MKKFRNIICALLSVMLTLSMLPCFAGPGGLEKFLDTYGKPRDEINYYQCSFDVKLDSSFSEHFVYDYAEDGILHVECDGGGSGGGATMLFSFGNAEKISVEASPKYSNSGFAVKGEWQIWNCQDYEYVWDDIEGVTDEEKGTYLLYKNRKVVALNSQAILKERQSSLYLSIDMIENEDKLIIQMYLFDPNDTTLAGTVTPLSTVANYIPSSFKEFNGTFADGSGFITRRTYLFKSNGEYANAVAGTEEAEALEKERQELLDSLVDYTPTEVITYDKSEVEEPEDPPGRTDDKEEGTDASKDTDTPDSTGNVQDVTEDTTEPTKTDATPEETLEKLGLLKGTGDGNDLSGVLTRAQGAAMLVRILGKEQTALAQTPQGIFQDVSADDWAAAYIEYCYAYGITKGTSATTYAPEESMSGSQYLTLVLRALGYTALEPENAETIAVLSGVVSETQAEQICRMKVLSRETMVQISYGALTVTLPTGKTLIESLAEDNAVDAEAAEALGLLS